MRQGREATLPESVTKVLIAEEIRLKEEAEVEQLNQVEALLEAQRKQIEEMNK